MTVYSGTVEHKATKIVVLIEYDDQLQRLRAIANIAGSDISEKQRQAMYAARLHLWGEPADRPVEHGCWVEYISAPDVDAAEAIVISFFGDKWEGWGNGPPLPGGGGGGGPGGGPGGGGGGPN